MVHSPQLDLTLPYVTSDLPGMGGIIRAHTEFFRVVEVPAYEPLGYGDHIYLNITKQERTTRETQIELSKLFGLRRENVGHAGLKDKYAVSTQTFSLLMPGEETKEEVKLIESSLGLTVNWARRHPKKLRSGHLKGNTFTITITDLDTPMAEALTMAERINEVVARVGIPNYFGSQRTGRDGRNVIDGLNLITGKYHEHNRWLRRFLVSSYLSYLCNRYLSERVFRGLFTTLLRGDLAKKHDTGGVFTVEDVATEQQRFDAGEISFTAPIFGYKLRESKYEAREFEDEIFAGSMVTFDQLRKLGADGTRRLGRILPIITIKPHPEGITLSFTLPAGGYATVVLREFMKKEAINKLIDAEIDEPDDVPD